jgi:hypothetical protein
VLFAAFSADKLSCGKKSGNKIVGTKAMRSRTTLLVVVPGLVVCVILIWLCSAIEGRDIIYEVEPPISVPEYRSDAARAIDAYERLMDQYMYLIEGNLTQLGSDVQRTFTKLDSIDGKLAGLSARMARIEQALGIEQPKPQAKNQSPSGGTDAKQEPKPEPTE